MNRDGGGDLVESPVGEPSEAQIGGGSIHRHVRGGQEAAVTSEMDDRRLAFLECHGREAGGSNAPYAARRGLFESSFPHVQVLTAGGLRRGTKP